MDMAVNHCPKTCKSEARWHPYVRSHTQTFTHIWRQPIDVMKSPTLNLTLTFSPVWTGPNVLTRLVQKYISVSTRVAKKCLCTPSLRSPPGCVCLWLRWMNVHPLPNGMRNVSGCSFALISRPDLILERELGLWLSASQGRVYSDIVSGDKHMTACSPLLDSWGHILIKTSLNLDLNATKKVLFISTDFVKNMITKLIFS